MNFLDGHRFSSSIQLTPSSVIEFARRSGDDNPIHHNLKYARKSKYGGLVASGPHTSALLMSMTATYFSQFSPMVGVEFSFRFKKPVLADEEVRLEWMVIKSRSSRKFGGKLIDLRGRMLNSLGQTVVGAKGLVLLSKKLI